MGYNSAVPKEIKLTVLDNLSCSNTLKTVLESATVCAEPFYNGEDSCHVSHEIST